MELQEISTIMAGISLSIMAFYYVLNIRNNAKNIKMTLETRQAQLFMQIYSTFNSTDFFDKFTDVITWRWKDYDDFMKKYGRVSNPRAWNSLGSVAAFFEGIGVLVQRNLINVDLVAQLWSRHIIMFWEKIEPISLEMRRRLNLPVDIWLEYIYKEVKPLVGKQTLEPKT